MNIVCIGAGRVGGISMAVMAKYHPDSMFTVLDKNPKLIKQWDSDSLPFEEHGLFELVARGRNKNLRFIESDSERARGALKEADVVFIAVDMYHYDISNFVAAAEMVRDYCAKDIWVVIRSTAPVGTHEKLDRILRHERMIAVNPEFMAEGAAVSDLEHPDRVVIGIDWYTSMETETDSKLHDLYKSWVPESKVITTDPATAEICKLAANAFLAQRISSINTINNLCDKVGGDINDVVKCLGADPRIGTSFLRPGLGYGGSCFSKDLMSLRSAFRDNHIKYGDRYWAEVDGINYEQIVSMVNSIKKAFYGSLKDRKIVLLGKAFKPGTDDTRNSRSIMLAEYLRQDGAEVVICDPMADSKNKDHMVELVGADAVVLCTEWPEYVNLDFEAVRKVMDENVAWAFDGRNVWSDDELLWHGFKVGCGDGYY